MIVLAVIFFAVNGSYYYVNEQENAVVTMFGKVVRTDTAGLYFKIPFIQQVEKVDVTTHGTGVGYSIDGNGQNITDDANGIMITSDFNLLNIDFYLEYKVSDPVAYLYNTNNPEEILKNIALSSIRSVVSNYTVDEAMTILYGTESENIVDPGNYPDDKEEATEEKTTETTETTNTDTTENTESETTETSETTEKSSDSTEKTN